MNPLYSALAILPGLLIAFFIYRADCINKERPLHLILCFFLGMAVTVPAMYLEQWGVVLGWEESEHLGLVFLFATIVVGFNEEITKYLALLAYPYTRSFFDEPIDGVVYAVMIGMGFATLENLLYASQFGLNTILVRAFTAVPAHAIFAVISGYYVGYAKFRPKQRVKCLVLGIVVPIFIHGLYDFFIIQERYDWLMSFATLVLLLAGYWAWILIKKLQKEMEAVYKKEKQSPTVSAPSSVPENLGDNDILDAIVEELEEDDNEV